MPNSPRYFALPLALILLFAAPGCTALQAIGSGSPDFSSIRPGASRADVEAALGRPIARVKAARGQIEDVYQYYAGERSGYAQALSNLFSAFFTLGASEAFALFSTDPDTRHRLRITYDENGRVVSLTLDEGQGDELYFNQFD